MKALLRWVAPVTASQKRKRCCFAAFRREMLSYLHWMHSVRDWRWVTHSWTDSVLEESCILFPVPSTPASPHLHLFSVPFQARDTEYTQKKKTKRKTTQTQQPENSGQQALTKRNFTCSSHLRANLICHYGKTENCQDLSWVAVGQENELT